MKYFLLILIKTMLKWKTLKKNMICNTCNLTSRNKKIKMSNQKIYIPSGSIGEIKYDD